MTGRYTGGCLCGAVRFEAGAICRQVAHCHCSMCRKFHGAAFATIASVPRSEFRWVSGEDALKSYTAENRTTRTFCGECGSSLMFSSPRAPEDVVEIALGTFDGGVPVEPDAHIFVGSRASWVAVKDDLPRFKEGRDSELLTE